MEMEKSDNLDARRRIAHLGIHAIQRLKYACILSDMQHMMPEIDRVALGFDILVKNPTYKLDTVGQNIKHLISRIHDELDSQYYFHVDQRDVSCYLAKEPFGEAVTNKFSLATEDISEAGKCLALQRSTACVFHLMRALELGVQTLGKRLKVQIDVRTETWHQIMLHVNKQTQALPSATRAQKAKKSKFAEAAAHLQSVRLAWRNEVMHPKQTYDRNEAFEIYNATRVFMASLAEIV
jgi:hypothetical protein